MAVMSKPQQLTVPPIGALLIASDQIIPQDLDFALEHQRYSKDLIGEILVRMGAVDREELERILGLQKVLSAQ